MSAPPFKPLRVAPHRFAAFVPAVAPLSLGRAAFLAALLPVVALGSLGDGIAADPRGEHRLFVLSLDGMISGILEAVDGGAIFAEVIMDASDPSPGQATRFAKKHLGPPKYENLELRVGLDHSKPIYDWIHAS